MYIDWNNIQITEDPEDSGTAYLKDTYTYKWLGGIEDIDDVHPYFLSETRPFDIYDLQYPIGGIENGQDKDGGFTAKIEFWTKHESENDFTLNLSEDYSSRGFKSYPWNEYINGLMAVNAYLEKDGFYDVYAYVYYMTEYGNMHKRKLNTIKTCRYSFYNTSINWDDYKDGIITYNLAPNIGISHKPSQYPGDDEYDYITCQFHQLPYWVGNYRCNNDKMIIPISNEKRIVGAEFILKGNDNNYFANKFIKYVEDQEFLAYRDWEFNYESRLLNIKMSEGNIPNDGKYNFITYIYYLDENDELYRAKFYDENYKKEDNNFKKYYDHGGEDDPVNPVNPPTPPTSTWFNDYTSFVNAFQANEAITAYSNDVLNDLLGGASVDIDQIKATLNALIADGQSLINRLPSEDSFDQDLKDDLEDSVTGIIQFIQNVLDAIDNYSPATDSVFYSFNDGEISGYCNTVDELKNIILYEADTITQCTLSGKFEGENISLQELFKEQYGLKTIDLTNLDVSNVTDMSGMFYGCTELEIIKIGYKWNTDKVINSYDMFYNCNSLPNFDNDNPTDKIMAIPTFDGGYLTLQMQIYWDTDIGLSGAADSWADMAYEMNFGIDDYSDAKWLKVWGVADEFWSVPLGDVITFDISDLNTKYITNTDLEYAFSTYVLEEIIGIENLHVDNITDFSNMFNSCGIKQLDLSNWNVSNAITFESMFEECENLIEINVSNWDTTNVEDMDRMFYNCGELKTIYSDRNFNISHVLSSDDMFFENRKLVGYCYWSGDKINADMANLTSYFWNDSIVFSFTTDDLSVGKIDVKNTGGNKSGNFIINTPAPWD